MTLSLPLKPFSVYINHQRQKKKSPIQQQEPHMKGEKHSAQTLNVLLLMWEYS